MLNKLYKVVVFLKLLAVLFQFHCVGKCFFVGCISTSKLYGKGWKCILCSKLNGVLII